MLLLWSWFDFSLSVPIQLPLCTTCNFGQVTWVSILQFFIYKTEMSKVYTHKFIVRITWTKYIKHLCIASFKPFITLRTGFIVLFSKICTFLHCPFLSMTTYGISVLWYTICYLIMNSFLLVSLISSRQLQHPWR